MSSQLSSSWPATAAGRLTQQSASSAASSCLPCPDPEMQAIAWQQLPQHYVASWYVSVQRASLPDLTRSPDVQQSATTCTGSSPAKPHAARPFLTHPSSTCAGDRLAAAAAALRGQLERERAEFQPGPPGQGPAHAGAAHLHGLRRRRRPAVWQMSARGAPSLAVWQLLVHSVESACIISGAQAQFSWTSDSHW